MNTGVQDANNLGWRRSRAACRLPPDPGDRAGCRRGCAGQVGG
ncbi:hypothetical protein [Streptomyces rapamycinicus]